MSIQAWENAEKNNSLYREKCVRCNSIEVSSHPTTDPGTYICGACRDWDDDKEISPIMIRIYDKCKTLGIYNWEQLSSMVDIPVDDLIVLTDQEKKHDANFLFKIAGGLNTTIADLLDLPIRVKEES